MTKFVRGLISDPRKRNGWHSRGCQPFWEVNVCQLSERRFLAAAPSGSYETKQPSTQQRERSWFRNDVGEKFGVATKRNRPIRNNPDSLSERIRRTASNGAHGRAAEGSAAEGT